MQNKRFEVEVDQATPEAWSQLLELFDDANIYQTAAYGGVRWGERNLSRIVLKRDNEVVGIAQLRIVRPTPLKFGMAYLRWGPLWERRGQPLDPEVPLWLGGAIQEEYIERRKLFVRIVPNAFVGSFRATTMLTALSRFSIETGPENTYRTISVDLRPSLEDLRRAFDKKWRNQLTRSEKNGLTVTSGNSSAQFCIFSEMYRQMLQRKQFDTTIDIDEFAQMQEKLPDYQRMQVLIAERDGVPAAGIVASAMGDSAVYLLGATSDHGLEARGAYLLQWTLIQALKTMGIKQYDLGGIDPEGNPGVYHFKKGLSGTEVSHLSPIVGFSNGLSSGIVKAGLAMHRTLKQFAART